jgi:hypothetical protein
VLAHLGRGSGEAERHRGSARGACGLAVEGRAHGGSY